MTAKPAMLCPLCGDHSTDREICEHDGQALVSDLSGAEVGGRYSLIALAGVGAHGSTVWEADSPDGDAVAVKLIDVKPGQAVEPVLDRIVSELAVDCPACVRAIDSGIWRGRVYVVTPLLDLDALSDHLAPRPQPDKALRLGRAILHALVPLHATGRAHGNLHPANVFIDADADPVVIKLLDAGQSAPCFASRPTGDPRMLEPTRTFAPEQLAADEIAPCTDVYQVAALMYRLATGRAHFETPDAEHLIRLKMTAQPETPACLDETPRLRDVLRRALLPRRGQRYTDAAAMLAALDAPSASDGETVVAALPTIGVEPAARGAGFAVTDGPAPVVATAPPGLPPPTSPAPTASTPPLMALDAPQKERRSRGGLMLLVLLILGVGAFWLLRDQRADPTQSPALAEAPARTPTAPVTTSASAASAQPTTTNPAQPQTMAAASAAGQAASEAEPHADPKAPTSTPQRVQVAITSAPKGAAVTLDGQFVGKTPWLTQLTKGDYTVGLTLPGYADKTQALAVDGEPVSVEVDLAKKKRRWRPRRTRKGSARGKVALLEKSSARAAPPKPAGVPLLDTAAAPKPPVPLLSAPPPSRVKLLDAPGAPAPADRRSAIKLLGQ